MSSASVTSSKREASETQKIGYTHTNENEQLLLWNHLSFYSKQKAVQQFYKILIHTTKCMTQPISFSKKHVSELKQEIEGMKALNRCLSAHLAYLRAFKKDLAAMDDNFYHLAKVNTEWLQMVPKIEKKE